MNTVFVNMFAYARPTKREWTKRIFTRYDRRRVIETGTEAAAGILHPWFWVQRHGLFVDLIFEMVDNALEMLLAVVRNKWVCEEQLFLCRVFLNVSGVTAVRMLCFALALVSLLVMAVLLLLLLLLRLVCDGGIAGTGIADDGVCGGGICSNGC